MRPTIPCELWLTNGWSENVILSEMDSFRIDIRFTSLLERRCPTPAEDVEVRFIKLFSQSDIKRFFRLLAPL
jgi:hypothetical protein